MRKEGSCDTHDAFEFFVELVSQLFDADVLIAEQAEPIETLEAEIARLRAAPDGTTAARPRERPPPQNGRQTVVLRGPPISR